MATPGLHDIQIGRDRRIKVVDVEGRHQSAVDIDFLILPFKPFWDALETVCVAECCGIDAFGFYPAEIGRASQVMEEQELQIALDSLLRFIKESPSDIFVSRLLNNYFDRIVILQLLEHILYNVDSDTWAFERDTKPSNLS